jgi:hypothetical protein
MPGIAINFDVFDASLGKIVSHSVDRAAKQKGGSRGYPSHRRVLWTVQEGLQDGIKQIPILAMIVGVKADFGFSVNPRDCRFFARPDEPVVFDEMDLKRLLKEDSIDPDFDKLDILNYVRI